MKEAEVKLDLENDTAVIMGQDVALNFTTSGHYCIPIDKSETVPMEEVNLVKLEELEPEKLKSALLKLHRQFAHCLLYTSPSPRDLSTSRMPSSA